MGDLSAALRNSLLRIATLFVLRCLGYTDREYRDYHMTANHRYLNLSSLSRRPVLIAMIVYLVAYGAATFAVWREATSISSHRKCENGSVESVGGSETHGLRTSEGSRHFLI
jgi:hypothetical protein